MSFTKIFPKGAVALSVFSLLFVISCGKDDSKKTDRKDIGSQSECPDCEKQHTHDEAEAKADSDKVKAPATTEKDDIYAETVADLTWGDEDETLFYYTVNFIAEEGEGVDGGEFGGKPFKNRPIEVHTVEHINEIKRRKGYKPGIKPLKHQKIKIKYEKTYPYNFGFLEHSKYRDEQGNIVELK